MICETCWHGHECVTVTATRNWPESHIAFYCHLLFRKVSQFISQPSFRFRSSVLRNTPWMIYTLTLGSLLKTTNTQNVQNLTAIRSRQPRISWPWQPWTVTTWTFTCLQITLDNLAERWVCNKTASQFLHENDIRLTSVTQCKRFTYQLYYK